MKYYLHDSNSFNDEKITKLFMEFGYEGLGLYYTLLEKLALQEKPIDESVLKKQLYIGKKLKKCWNFIHKIDLISTKNNQTFSKTLLNFSENYQIKKEKNRKRILEWRTNQKDKKYVTSNKQVRNKPKVKESKVKESKVKKTIKNKLSFYSNQIKNIEEKEGLKDRYISLVGYLFGENAIGVPVEHILKLEKQLTYDEYKKLFSASHAKNLTVGELLDSWVNSPKYSKNKVSIYLTLNNWINRSDGKNIKLSPEKKWTEVVKTGETLNLLEIINKMSKKKGQKK